MTMYDERLMIGLSDFEKQILKEIPSNLYYNFYYGINRFPGLENSYMRSTGDPVSDKDLFYEWGYWPKNCERDRIKFVVKFFAHVDISNFSDEIKNKILAYSLVMQ